jgi:hypothetical protein
MCCKSIIGRLNVASCLVVKFVTLWREECELRVVKKIVQESILNQREAGVHFMGQNSSTM